MRKPVKEKTEASPADQGLHIAPCSECDFWSIYEFLWQTPFGLFCEECFHEQVFIPVYVFKDRELNLNE